MTDRLGNRMRLKGCANPVLHAIIAAVLIASSFGFATGAHAASPMAAVFGPTSFVDLVEALGPAVVSIRASAVEKGKVPRGLQFDDGLHGDLFRRFFGDVIPTPRQHKVEILGSGVIIEADGTILTNNHVIEGAREIFVILRNGEEYKAHVLGRDPKDGPRRYQDGLEAAAYRGEDGRL